MDTYGAMVFTSTAFYIFEPCIMALHIYNSVVVESTPSESKSESESSASEWETESES